jgi:hypothetical protein
MSRLYFVLRTEIFVVVFVVVIFKAIDVVGSVLEFVPCLLHAWLLKVTR